MHIVSTNKTVKQRVIYVINKYRLFVRIFKIIFYKNYVARGNIIYVVEFCIKFQLQFDK